MDRVESKKIFKILGVIVLGLICYVSMITSAAAFNAQDEAKIISVNPENIYTVYLGMPRSDVDANFEGVKGWNMHSDAYSYRISRDYSKWASVKAGAQLKQQVLIVFDGTNHVSQVSTFFFTDSMRVAQDLYKIMYNNLVAQYGTPYKTRQISQAMNSTIWFANGHTYDLIYIQGKKSFIVNLIVRPVLQSDY